MLTQYGQVVYSCVSRIVARREDAEEVYQDVFVKAFQGIDSYDEQQASLITWLCRIAYNESLNFVRRHKLSLVYSEESSYDLNNQQDELSDADDEPPNEQKIQLMEAAMELLPREEQAILSMYYYEGLSLKEIAFITNSNPSTVGSKLCRIRRRLYSIIKSQIR